MRKAAYILLLLTLFTTMVVAQDAEKSRRYDAMFLEAICQREKGNSDAAFDLLRHCVDIDSTRSEAYFYLRAGTHLCGALNAHLPHLATPYGRWRAGKHVLLCPF